MASNSIGMIENAGHSFHFLYLLQLNEHDNFFSNLIFFRH